MAPLGTSAPDEQDGESDGEQDGELHRVLDARAVRAVYQPLVDLRTGETVGFEALARGPEGSPLARPDLLFAAARRVGRLPELDWVCRAAAYRGALAAGLPDGLTLFVNTEPDALGTPCPPDLLPDVERAEATLRLVTEMTERSLARDPHALLDAVARWRRVGCGVALDDVGVDPASLALMPFVQPDVVKLDMTLVQEPPDEAASRVASAVRAHAERTGCVVLCEGIETEHHRRRALALGATVGQGWLLGRPGPLPPVPAPSSPLPLRAVDLVPPGSTPCGLVRRDRTLQVATKGLLLPVSKHLERRALDDPEPPVVLATFQEAPRFTPLTTGRYARLARRSTLVAALGVGMSTEPVAGVRGGRLTADDPLADEWNVVVVGPHFAGALLAAEVPTPPGTPDDERLFEHVVTHDRDTVVRAAQALLTRLLPSA